MEQPTIVAGRLTLRPFTPADIGWVHEVSLDPLLQRFIELPSPYRREDADHFVREVAIAGWDDGLRAEFLVAATDTGERLGRTALWWQRPGIAGVGYWVAPAARGRGVASEALRAASRWGFAELRLQLLEWRAEVGNHASRRTAEKAGFTVEAVLRQRLLHRGLWVDAWVGSLLAEEAERIGPVIPG